MVFVSQDGTETYTAVRACHGSSRVKSHCTRRTTRDPDAWGGPERWSSIAHSKDKLSFSQPVDPELSISSRRSIVELIKYPKDKDSWCIPTTGSISPRFVICFSAGRVTRLCSSPRLLTFSLVSTLVLDIHVFSLSASLSLCCTCYPCIKLLFWCINSNPLLEPFKGLRPSNHPRVHEIPPPNWEGEADWIRLWDLEAMPEGGVHRSWPIDSPIASPIVSIFDYFFVFPEPVIGMLTWRWAVSMLMP